MRRVELRFVSVLVLSSLVVSDGVCCGAAASRALPGRPRAHERVDRGADPQGVAERGPDRGHQLWSPRATTRADVGRGGTAARPRFRLRDRSGRLHHDQRARRGQRAARAGAAAAGVRRRIDRDGALHQGEPRRRADRRHQHRDRPRVAEDRQAATPRADPGLLLERSPGRDGVRVRESLWPDAHAHPRAHLGGRAAAGSGLADSSTCRPTRRSTRATRAGRWSTSVARSSASTRPSSRRLAAATGSASRSRAQRCARHSGSSSSTGSCGGRRWA